MADTDIDRLLGIMTALRTPETGCAWDLAQTSVSIAPYTIEEAYEVVDAIERDDAEDLRDELGDLLLQVVLHARLAEEAGRFAFQDVVAGLCAKMVRQHPHVFGSEASGTAPVGGSWEDIKADERRLKQERLGRLEPEGSVLSGVPVALPALTRALKLQQKAARVGFDWADIRPVLAKMREEIDEIESALAAGSSDEVRDEVGDMLFALANLARHLDVDPEAAVRRTNAKFERRFAYIERSLAARESSPKTSSLAEMDALWDEAKRYGL